MNLLSTPSYTTWFATWSDLSFLLRELYTEITTQTTIQKWDLVGTDSRLCQDLEQLWQHLNPYGLNKSKIFGNQAIFGPIVSISNYQTSRPSSPNLVNFDFHSCQPDLQTPSFLKWVWLDEAMRHRLLHVAEPFQYAANTLLAPNLVEANLLILTQHFPLWLQIRAQSDDRWQVVLIADYLAIAIVQSLRSQLTPTSSVTLDADTAQAVALRHCGFYLQQMTGTSFSSTQLQLDDSSDPLQHAPIGVLRLGLDGSLLHANTRFCDLVGLSKAQLRRRDLASISSPEDFAIEQLLIQQMVEQRWPRQQLQKRFLTTNGTVLAEVTYVLVGSPEADEGHLLAYVNDLSDRQRIEAELQQHQAGETLLHEITAQTRSLSELETILQSTVDRLRKALKVDRALVYQINPDGSGQCLVESVDSQFSSMLGQAYSPDCIPSSYLEAYRLGRLWTVDDIANRHTLADCHHKMLQQVQVHSMMAIGIHSIDYALRPDQRSLWGLLVIHHCRHSHHWTIDEKSLFKAIANQIAMSLEHTRLLHHLQLQNQELENRNEYLQAFVEQSTDVFVEHDLTLRYQSVNPAGCDLFGRSRHDLIGKTNQELFGANGIALDQLMQYALDTNQQVSVNHELTLSESTKIIEIAYLPVADRTGIIQRIIGIGRDITDDKQHWQQLEFRNQELAEATRVKQEFIATTSHELRTPLTAILGFSNVLLQEFFGELNPKQRDYLERIYSSGQHLLELINDILDLSKLEADRLELDWQNTYISDICIGITSLIQERVDQKGLTLQVEIDSSIECVLADPRRLKQMLLNLLSNSIKFTEKGTVGLRVYRQSKELEPTSNIPQDWVHFAVWDTGIGIQAMDQHRLFSPFSQIHSPLTRHHEGTGLGLAITRKLAELHGGSISVESAPQQGSCFTLSLPLIPNESSK